MDEKESQVRNYEAELIMIRNECIEKASELTSILKSIESVKNENVELELKKVEIQSYCGRIRSELTEQKVQIDTGKKNLIELKETVTKELKQLKEDIKVSNKELGWVNDKVFKAKEELEEVEKNRGIVQLRIDEMNSLLKQVPFLETEIKGLDDKKLVLRSDISNMINESTEELNRAKEMLEKIKQNADQKLEEANQSEYRTKKYVDELYTHMNDYEVIRSRLENIWGKTFPELELKI